jgi:hypothetical protein
MREFSFEYEAVKYKHFTVKVKAKTIEEAIKLADEKADDKRFPSGELHRIGLENDETFKYAQEHL